MELSKQTRNVIRIISTYAVLLICFIFFILPMLWITYTSFRGSEAIFSGKVLTPMDGFTLEHYKTILSVTDFLRFFVNSLRIAVVVSIIAVTASILGAYGLSRFRVPKRNLLLTGIFSTQMFPKILMIVPLYTIIVAFRMLDTTIGIVLTQMILVLPFASWMLKGYFDNLPQELEDSARVDGCNIFQTLFRIIIPIAAPGILVAAFYSFVVSWGDYLIVSVIAQSQRTATLPLVLQRLSSALNIRWGQVAAASVLTIVPTVALFALVNRWLVSGLTAGAVKG
jgi:ABC-type glycerol-3-phosphate transport system permease component